MDNALKNREAEENGIVLLSGNSNRDLAREIAECLDLELGRMLVSTFSDGEIRVKIEENIRGVDCYIIQSTCNPVNHNLMELLIMIDAASRASASRITAVIPYYGYGRQDRKDRPRVPITAKLVANLLTAAGADRILTVDLHADQIQGFFDIPVDHLNADAVLIGYLRRYAAAGDCVVVSPDTGGAERTRRLGGKIEVPLAIIDKRRPEPNVAVIMHVIGDVAGKTAIIVDDMVDTAGTLTHVAKALISKGAKSVRAVATHPVLSGPALDRINESVLDELIVTNTIPLSEKARASAKVTQISVASHLAEAIRRIHFGESVSSLFVG